jgi:hypothetical protein
VPNDESDQAEVGAPPAGASVDPMSMRAIAAGGTPKLPLLRESLFTAAVGLACFGRRLRQRAIAASAAAESAVS